MANKPITKQELINASIDAETLGEAANEDVFSQDMAGHYKSVPMVSREGEEAVEVRQSAPA